MTHQGHPNVALVREGFEALQRGDTAWMDQHLADDVVWHVGGNSKWAGAHAGKAKVLEYFARQAQAINGHPRWRSTIPGQSARLRGGQGIGLTIGPAPTGSRCSVRRSLCGCDARPGETVTITNRPGHWTDRGNSPSRSPAPTRPHPAYKPDEIAKLQQIPRTETTGFKVRSALPRGARNRRAPCP
jgi:hypothetical protein